MWIWNPASPPPPSPAWPHAAGLDHLTVFEAINCSLSKGIRGLHRLPGLLKIDLRGNALEGMRVACTPHTLP